MKIKTFKGWRTFVTRELAGYSNLPPERHKQLIFRGHANAKWKLRATLDRQRTFASPEERDDYARRLLRAFRAEVRGLAVPFDTRALTEDEWEMLARHHGVPTTILDWTRSPFAAAYFALAEEPP